MAYFKLLLFSIVISLTHCATITCPTLTCSTTLGDNLCFVHSGDSPVTSIEMFEWAPNEVCAFEDNQFAWVDSSKQQYSATNGATTANSQIYFKDTQYQCKNAGRFNVNLNAGTSCSSNVDCVTRYCKSGTWYGRSSGESCRQHSDCDKKLACITSSTYPYAATCQSWLTSGSCNDDYDCAPQYFWWYASASAASTSTKTCLEKFSQADGTTFGWKTVQSNAALDGLSNGKYCTSGFARESATNTATCMTISKIVSDLGTQSSPYKCTATDTTKTCDYYYDSSNYVSAQCQCGLDGSSGYWPVPGQDELTTHVTYIKALDAINGCHTLDRFNYRRLRQGCLTDSADSYWQNAADSNYSISFWPFTQGTTVSAWMEDTFYLSLTNISKDDGLNQYPLFIITMVVIGISYYLF